MGSDFVAFLRGITNVPMQPFRDALSGIGLTDVRSFGGTGNLMFNSHDTDRAELARRIADAVGVEAFIRSRAEMATIVAEDPFAGRDGAALFFSNREFDSERVAALLGGEFEGEPPVVAGQQVYFVHPLRRPGRMSVIDFERELAVRGTMRASRVAARVAQLM